MIDPLPGWTWELRASGVCMTSAVGQIRYAERVRPLRTAHEIVRSLAPVAGFTPDGEPAIERVLTREHEYAAVITLGGTGGTRAVGVVWLDDWYALVDGFGADRARILAAVKRLVDSDMHMLGERRRRFLYRPPAGWRGLLVPPYHAYWLAPGFPREPTYVAVFPAFPRAALAAAPETVIAALGGLSHGTQEPARRVHALQCAPGLTITELDADVTGLAVPTTRSFVVLQDRRYLYPLLLETATAQVPLLTPTLRALVRSVEPLPGGELTALPVDLWPE